MAAIISENRGMTLQRYAFKPLPVLLMLLVVYASASAPVLIKILFACGLICSATGDLLLIDRRRFIYGLLAFLAAHIFYIFAIWSGLDHPPRVLYVLPLTLWGGAVYWLLKKHLHELELPVLIYITVILVMVWLAAEQYHQRADTGSMLLLSGAVSFALSDTILALDHFRKPFKSARFFVLSTYYLAQICIACSLLFYA